MFMAEGQAGIEIHGARGWLVGIVVDGELCGRWRYAQFIRRPPAVAFYQAVLDKLDALGVTRYTIRNVDAGTLYTITAERFAHYKYAQDGGAGMQWRCPLCYWDSVPLVAGAEAMLAA